MTGLKRVEAKYRESGLRGLAGGALRRAASLVDQPVQREAAVEVPLRAQRYDHQLSAHRVLSRYMSFAGKDVLEVGGAQAGDSMRPFLKDGAASGVVSGLDHITDDAAAKESNFRVARADARELSTVFGPESFDVVYGLSIVEHIRSPGVFLDEVYAVLRPGGLAYLEGNPIWSSALGHHLWVSTWGGGYAGRATANYLFTPWPDQPWTNPLPDWAHLLMDADEMRTHLAAKRLPEVDIDCIVDWVYSEDNINRLTMPEIAAAYTGSKLVVLEANTGRVDVPHDVLAALRERNGEGIDYGVASVVYVLSKPREGGAGGGA